MKARLLFNLGCRPSPEFPSGVKPAGTVIDHPDAYKLVRRGCAEAADEECERAANVTPEQFARAHAAYPKVAAGVLPEDYWAWDKGYMRGYEPDGTWKPGPNSEEYEWEGTKATSPIIIVEDRHGD